MKHTYFDAAQKKITGWVKNARNFAEEHPILMATGGLVGGGLIGGGLVGGALYAMSQASGASNPAAVARFPRNEAVASSNTFSERPVLLGNMRGI